MTLAAGEWQAAADGYESLLDDSRRRPGRAEVLRGRAEALARLDRGREAVAAAAEAARIFGIAGPNLRRGARPLLAGLRPLPVGRRGRCAQPAVFPPRAGARRPEGGARVRDAAADRAGRRRVAQSATTRSRWPTSRRPVAWPRTWTIGAARCSSSTWPSATGRRATSRRRSGPAPRAWRCCARPARRSNRPRSRTTWPWPIWPPATWRVPGELAGEARREFEEAGDERFLSAVLDTEAQVALASDDAAEAITLARRAVEMAGHRQPRRSSWRAMLTEARALRANGDARRPRAATTRPRHGPRGPCTRRVCARSCASGPSCAPTPGDHRGAYELTREALSVN